MKNKYILFLLVVAVIVFRKWLSFEIFTGGDWPFYYSETLKFFTHASLWDNLNSFGIINLIIWRLPIDFFQGVFGSLGLSSNVSEKILIFWPSLIVANLSAFFLIKKITKSNLASFVGGIVFNYNTYYFVANTAFLLYAAGAWSLLTILIFILAIEKKIITILFYLALHCS